MKCFNLTDVPTPELVKRGLVNATLAVRSVIIKPGDSAEVPDDHIAQRDAAGYVKVGALAVGNPPVMYVVQKSRTQKSAPAQVPPPKKKPEPAPVMPAAVPEEKKV